MNDERITGKVVFLHPKGWGFLSSASHPFTRIYFHWSHLTQKINFNSLRKGDVLSFVCVEYTDKRTNENRGLRALKIESGKKDGDDIQV